MADYLPYLLLFVFGGAAGFINVMAGGGSTLTLPLMIFLGLDASVANGSNRIAIFIQNLSAVASFKSEKYSEWKLSGLMGLFTLPGAALGAALAVNLADDTFELILGFIMLGVVISMLLPNKFKAKTNEDGKINWWIAPAMVGVGFYGGFLQVGVGFLLMAAIHYIMQMDLVRVNMHKVAIVLLYTLPALAIFILNDKVDWAFGLTVAAGNAVGAWISAKLAIKKGEKVVKIVMIIAVVIMALKLIGVF